MKLLISRRYYQYISGSYFYHHKLQAVVLSHISITYLLVRRHRKILS